MNYRKIHWFAGSALMVVMATSAQAQSAAAPATAAEPEQFSNLEDIVVTARRTNENIQTTPVAVSALSAETLDKQQLTNVSQLANSTPNLTISNALAQPGSATLFIRGQGTSDAIIAIDQAVGVYINGVYSARSTGGALEMIDMQRVEVLRGPQGTLFGRNTTGGALNLIPVEPSGVFGGSARIDYGNYDSILARAVVNLPIKGDEIAARIAVQHRQRDGYGRNLLLNKDIGADDAEFVRGSLRFAPADKPWSVLIQADYTDIDDSGQMVGLKGFRPTPSNQAIINACNGTSGPALAALCTFGRTGDTLANYLPGNNGLGFYDAYHNTDGYSKVNAYGVAVTAEYALTDSIDFKSITAWRGVRMDSLTDVDGTPYMIIGGFSREDGNHIDQDQFSQEFQLAGKSLEERLSWIAGVFYFKEDGFDLSRSVSLYPVGQGFTIYDAAVENKSYAAYGQATYNLTDTLRLTAGTRYTKDERGMVIRNRSVNLATGVVTGLYSPTDGDPADPQRTTFERSFSYWSYTLSLDWEVADGRFLYAKTSRANRAGGFNTRASTGGIPPTSFEPEEVTDYELGAKLELLDRRVRLNSAVFYTDFQNVQRNLTGVIGTRVAQGAANAGSAHIVGAEFEMTAVPTDNLTIGATIGLTYPEYDSFVSTIDGLDMSDTPFPYTPEQTYTLNVDYDWPLSNGRLLNFHADYSYRTETYSVPLKNGAFTQAQNDILQDTVRIPAYGLLNARIAYDLTDSVEVSIYGRNIAGKEYYARLIGLENSALGLTGYGPGDPRTYGVSAIWRF